MHVINVRNVTEALPEGAAYLSLHGIREETRNGLALVAPGPVTTVYQKPRERVLFSAVRDANPFFHFMEGLWMLLGRGDAAFLDRFIPNFGSRFAEPDGMIHGAYGRRWRNHFVNVQHTGDDDSVAPAMIDQLDLCIQELVRDPTSRQAVLAMWDPEVDLGVVGLKDRPCNTHVYFRVRQLKDPLNKEGLMDPVLDMTVCCRSNDIVLGAYGANAVHFSMLQEFVAAQVGVEVGTYTQVSNNYHVYLSEVDRLTARVPEGGSLIHEFRDYRYHQGDVFPFPLVTNPVHFIPEAIKLTSGYELMAGGMMSRVELDRLAAEFKNSSLSRTAWPMLLAHHYYKQDQMDMCVRYARAIDAIDWRTAVLEWLGRRAKK